MRFYADSVLLQTANGLTSPAVGASVQVNIHNGALATIYSDDGITTTSNPLTTNAQGRFSFYAADGRYDLKFSGTGFTTYTLSDVEIADVMDITLQGKTPISGNLQFTGNNTHSGTETFTGGVTAKSIENVQYCDQFPGADFGAQVTNCIAALPTLGGFKAGTASLRGFAGTAQTQSTAITITSPYVNVDGPGAAALQITCTLNADCWNVRTNPFGITGANKIGGFTLIGQGSGNANANGIHTGDMVGGEFYDLQIDNFLGTNSSCFWVDNTLGWFERNKIHRLYTGIHQATQSGCTKERRFTFSGAGSSSFGYNTWTSTRLSTISPNIGWSIESGVMYSNFIEGNTNIQGGATLFSVTSTIPQFGNRLAFRAENTAQTGVATIFNIGPGANFQYTGSVNTNGDNVHAGNTVSATGFLNPQLSDTVNEPIIWGSNSSNGLTIGTGPNRSAVGAYLIRNDTNNNNFQTGLGSNLYFDPTSVTWKTGTDGASNGASAIFSSFGGTATMNFYVVPSTGGSNQSITNANLTANNLQATLATTGFSFATSAGGTRLPATQTIASGTATMTTAAITGPNCGTTVTVSATGVLTTDTITFADNAAPAATTNGPLVIKAWPTANNVNFAYCVQSGTITPAAATLNFRVVR